LGFEVETKIDKSLGTRDFIFLLHLANTGRSMHPCIDVKSVYSCMSHQRARVFEGGEEERRSGPDVELVVQQAPGKHGHVSRVQDVGVKDA
jgi:hypothetical protein